MKVKDIYSVLDKIAPFSLAYDFDNVGLLVGDLEQNVSRVMVALDPSYDVIKQAVADNVQLLITHHPVTIDAIKTVCSGNYTGGLIYQLIRNNISLIAMHTNLDVANGGVNDVLANLLELQDIKTVTEGYSSDNVKLTFFVPQTHTEVVIGALADYRVAIFPKYDSCSFTTTGTGRFRAAEDANPYIGAVGELAKVNEDRVEMIIPRASFKDIMDIIVRNHPYEQPAYELSEISYPQTSKGILRIGKLSNTLSTEKLAKVLMKKLDSNNTTYTLPQKEITSVAICGGSGIDLFKTAKQHGADVLLTGEMKYHVAQEACNKDIAIIAVGHQESELSVVGDLANRLRSLLTCVEVCVAKETPYIYSYKLNS